MGSKHKHDSMLTLAFSLKGLAAWLYILRVVLVFLTSLCFVFFCLFFSKADYNHIKENVYIVPIM